MKHEESQSLPTFLSRKALHARLKPELTPDSFNNWLARASARWGFPAPVRFGARGVTWNEREVLAWIEARPRGGTFAGRRRTNSTSGEAA